MSLLKKLDRIPPFLCRLLARKNHGCVRLSHAEIAARSGLAKSTVSKLSGMESWRGVSVEVIEAFSLACGVDHLRSHSQLDYLRRRGLTHIARGGGNERRMYAGLLDRLERWCERNRSGHH